MEGDSIVSKKEAKVMGLSQTNIKTSIFLFIAVFVIYSVMFVEHVLKHVPGATKGMEVTDTGYVVQGLLTALAYLIINYMVTTNII